MKKEWTGERLETGIHSQVTAEHLHRYALAMEFVQDKIVLDIACGEGYGSNLLSKKAMSVIGVDIDTSTIAHAQEKYRKPNITFLEGTVEMIPVGDRSVDVIISFETLEHTANHSAFLSEIKRVLKPGGLLLISTPDKKYYSDKTGQVNPFHQKELYRDEFEAVLGKNFAHVNIITQMFFSGSVIMAIPSNGDPHFYSGNFENISRAENAEALYMIGFASDSALPPAAYSFFNGDQVMEAAVIKKETDIRNSMSYRLGHFLLAPAKWIKKLLSKA